MISCRISKNLSFDGDFCMRNRFLRDTSESETRNIRITVSASIKMSYSWNKVIVMKTMINMRLDLNDGDFLTLLNIENTINETVTFL